MYIYIYVFMGVCILIVCVCLCVRIFPPAKTDTQVLKLGSLSFARSTRHNLICYHCYDY